MTKKEIAAMIDKYRITDNRDGRIKINNTKIVTDEIYDQIIAAKPEIMAYWAEERAEKERRRQTFESIAGVKELRAARDEWREYHRAFNRAFESECGRFPTAPTVDEKAIAGKYPGAVFALMVEDRQYGANYELASMAKKAYDALCAGEPWEKVKTAYDAENKEFVNRHMWD